MNPTRILATTVLSSALLVLALFDSTSNDPTPSAIAEDQPVMMVEEVTASSLWPEVQRLRSELWATRQQLTRIRVDRNRLERELDAGPRQTLADLDRLWFAGYLGNGGQHPEEFRTIILPCESNPAAFASPHTIVGATDDWGRGQINRPVWRTTFEAMFSIDFETGIVDPALNGAMAAHIEQVQGLTAWTCWRNR